MGEFNRKGQQWSLDVLVGSLVFILTFFLFFTLLGTGIERPIQNELVSQSDVIGKAIDEKFVEKAEVTDLQALAAEEYDKMKEEFGVSRDFCIYFEDEEGNVIKIGNEYGKGSGDGKFETNNGDEACS